MSKISCMKCNRQAGPDFQEIFDEVGVELGLDRLLAEHFELHVLPCPTDTQVLCQECVNRLIDLLDIAERDRQLDPSETSGCHSQDLPIAAEDNEYILGEEDYISEHLSKETIESDTIENQAEFSIEISQKSETEEALDEKCKEWPMEFVNEDVEFVSLDNAETYNENSKDFVTNFNEEEQIDDGEKSVNTDFTTFNSELKYEDVVTEINVEEYLNEAIMSKLEDLKFEWKSNCRVCSKTFETFQAAFEHRIFHKSWDDKFCCVWKKCHYKHSSARLLARHIILMHCELHRLKIYSNCPYCGLRSSNFVEFNKHSCNRSIKNKPGLSYSCEACNLELSSLRRYIFHMQCHLIKHRPMVCLICGSFFSNGDKLFDHIYYGHEPNTGLTCMVCDRTFRDKSTYETHAKCHEKRFVYPYECEHCSKKYRFKSLLRRHMENNHSMVKESFKCDMCDKVLRTQKAYQEHVDNHLSKAVVQVSFCSKCGLIARDQSELLDHGKTKCFNAIIKQDVLAEAFTCEYCWADFRSSKDLGNHRLTGIHDDGVYHCSLCSKKFNQLKTMRIHHKSHATYKTYCLSFPLCRYFVCNIGDCQTVYSAWNSLYHHKRRHELQSSKDITKTPTTSTAEHQCQFCSKSCPSKMSLSVHVARSHNNRNINCPTCKRSYKNEEELQAHIEYMHLAIKCPSCFKLMKNKRNLETHVRVIHLNEKRYFCTECERGFYHKSEKDAHEKNMHPNCLYTCGHCSFTTRYPKSMDVHLAQHTQIMSFECTICGKKFARKAVLNIHIKRHENRKEFVCSERIMNGCDASFVSRYLLTRHIRSKHEKVEEKQSNSSTKHRKTATSEYAILYEEQNSMEDIDDPEVNDFTSIQSNAQIFDYIEDDDELVQESHEDGRTDQATIDVDVEFLEKVNDATVEA